MDDLMKKWLDSQGGRTMRDVFYDDKGAYVWMFIPDGAEKVYIPNENTLQYIFGERGITL